MQINVDEKDMPIVNIVVAGITGAGKSTLLNAVFDWEEAATGTGRAITEHMVEYHKAGVPVRAWDTVGLELDSVKTEKSIRDIRKTIEERALSKNERECIHAIWYCINSGSNRYQSAEIKFIKSLHESNVPFIIVLTQCTDDPERIDEFEKVIRSENEKNGLKGIDIIQVCAKDYKTRLGTIKSFGLPDLIHKTTERMPDFLVSSFIAAQNVCRENKRTECEKIMQKYVDQALAGFWEGLWILNIPSTSRDIKRLLCEIAKMYYQILDEDILNSAIARLSLNPEAIWKGLIFPWRGKYGKRVQEMFEKKIGNGYEGDFGTLPEWAKSARLIAYYGYIFIDSVEETWDWKNEQKIKEIKAFVNKLVDIINRKLDEDKQPVRI